MMVEHRFAHIPQDGRRGRAWIASLAPLVEASLADGATVPLGAFHRYHHLGDAVLVAFDGPAQTIERSERLVAAQGIDHVVLRSHTAGGARIMVGGRAEVAAPGDVVLIDLAHPIRIEAGPASGVEIVLPRRIVTAGEEGIPVRQGRILPADGHPLTRLVADHVRNLAACLAAAPVTPVAPLVPATVALCRALLATTQGRDGTAPAPDSPGLAVRRFIDENLATVDVPALAARFGLSHRALYRLFPDEGVSSFIRNRRLARAMRHLAQAPDGRSPKLARLAHDCGFADPRVFSRAFHRRYGLWPAAACGIRPRIDRGAHDPPPLAWLREL